MAQSVLIDIAIITVLGIGAQWVAWRLHVPSILLLLLAGFLAGPVTGRIDPDELFGELLLPFVSVSVALILYEGGLTLRRSELPKIGGAVRNLCTVGVIVTWIVSAVAAQLILGMGWSLSILLGAILVVTGPTVIGPMLRHIRPTGVSGLALKWEGIVIDPIGALLALLVFEIIFAGQLDHPGSYIAVSVVKTGLIGGGFGVVAAGVLTLMLNRSWIPDFLQNAVSVMFAVGVFTLAQCLQHESGLLAVTIMGLVLANQKFADIEHIVEFKENLRVLLISTLFVLLAARLEWSALSAVLVPGLLFVLVLVVVARPLSVLIAMLGTSVRRVDRLFIASMAPRGIVAAAVASVFALRLENAGSTSAHMLVPVTFTVIIGTVVVYGIGAPIIGRKLGVADANPQGVLFLGASPWICGVASVLESKGFRVLLVDTNRQHTAAARMADLPTYNGSILAEATLDDIDLGGLGKLVAATANDWVNVLAVQRFSPVFGKNQCYQLPPMKERGDKRNHHKHLHGRYLFCNDCTCDALDRAFSSEMTAKATRISEEFTYDDFRKRYGDSIVPLFVITEDNRLDPFTPDGKTPAPGQTLIALVHEPAGE